MNISVFLEGGPANGYSEPEYQVPLDGIGLPCLPDELDVDDLDANGNVVGRLLYSNRKKMEFPDNSYIYYYTERLKGSK